MGENVHIDAFDESGIERALAAVIFADPAARLGDRLLCRKNLRFGERRTSTRVLALAPKPLDRDFALPGKKCVDHPE
jgi:hypothetical protein